MMSVDSSEDIMDKSVICGKNKCPMPFLSDRYCKNLHRECVHEEYKKPYEPVIPIEYRFQIHHYSMWPKENTIDIYKSIEGQTGGKVKTGVEDYWILKEDRNEHALCYQPGYKIDVKLDWRYLYFTSPDVFYSHGFSEGIHVYPWFDTYDECYKTIQQLADATSCCFCIYCNHDGHLSLKNIMTGKHTVRCWDRQRYLWERIPARKRKRAGIAFTAQAVIPTILDPNKNPELRHMDEDFLEVFLDDPNNAV
jgi:hypothetical protein